MNVIIVAGVWATIGIQITLFALAKLFPSPPTAVTALSFPS